MRDDRRYPRVGRTQFGKIAHLFIPTYLYPDKNRRIPDGWTLRCAKSWNETYGPGHIRVNVGYTFTNEPITCLECLVLDRGRFIG